jgi:hypothetical protein
MNKQRFQKDIWLRKRHSREGGNPGYYTWESKPKRQKSKGGLAVLGGITALGAMTPGFPLPRE